MADSTAADAPSTDPPPPNNPSGAVAYVHAAPLAVSKIIAALHRAGIAPAELEQELGLPVQRIYRWKMSSGEPTGTELYRIARRLGVSLVYLANDEVGVMDEPPGFEG